MDVPTGRCRAWVLALAAVTACRPADPVAELRGKGAKDEAALQALQAARSALAADAGGEGMDILVELARVYAAGELSASVRLPVLRLVSQHGDARVAGALVAALQDAGREDGGGLEEATLAAGAVSRLHLGRAAEALLEAYLVLDGEGEWAPRARQAVRLAMLELHAPSWNPALVERAETRVDKVCGKDLTRLDAKHGCVGTSPRVYQKLSALLVLGRTGELQAVRPLFKAALAAETAEIRDVALESIIRLGPGSLPWIKDVLAGRDADLRARADPPGPGVRAVEPEVLAAMVLGRAGWPQGAEPLRDAVRRGADLSVQAAQARELPRVDPGNAAKAAFHEVLDRVVQSLRAGPPESVPRAREAAVDLLLALPRFYDGSLLPWAVAVVDAAWERAGRDPGTPRPLRARGGKDSLRDVFDRKGWEGLALPEQDGAEVRPWWALQYAGAVAVAKLALPGARLGTEHLPAELVASVIRPVEGALAQCGPRLGCWEELAQSKEANVLPRQVVGIKAGCMLGMLGNEATARRAQNLAPRVDNPAVRLALLRAADHLLRGRDGSGAALEINLEVRRDTEEMFLRAPPGPSGTP